MDWNATGFYFAYFMFCWLCVATYVSVILHRCLSHRAVLLPQWFIEGVMAFTASFILYVNPRVWVAEHRLHHTHSDTDEDPDKKPGWSLFKFITWSIFNPAGPHDEHVERITREPALNTPLMRLYSNPPFGFFCQMVSGWFLPYALTRSFWPTFAMWWGIRLGGLVVKSIQGYFAHNKAYGYRNFETDDSSVNCNGWFATFMSAGESLQNNHHARPTSPIHAFKAGERDFGYALVWAYKALGLATLPQKNTVTPVPEVAATA
ncbi:MAG TPA: fatty acid desaturase, partial [Planctomycetota bacterium]|nr:fatty acid desaturase [Planctomycetota bacterium]